MSTGIVLTLTGPDRVGIVEEVTRVVLSLGGNVETSRMARLGGEFAVLMLVALPAQDADVESAFADLVHEGYRLTVSRTERTASVPAILYQVEVLGADHEGIIHEIARELAARGINIESMETGTVPSPITGTPLFAMKAVVAVPAQMSDDAWLAALEDAGEQANVDVSVVSVQR